MSHAVWLLLAVALAGGPLGWIERGPPGPAIGSDDPRLHTGDWCGYCRTKRGDFERVNVRYRVLDVDTPEGDRAMRPRGAPVTVVGRDVVRGHDTARLDQHLTPLGYRVY